MVDVPFSTSDLYNWKTQNTSFSEKPQIQEEFEGKFISELVEIAKKVYNNRESPDERQTKKMSKILVTAMEGLRARKHPTRWTASPRARQPLDKDQCTNCKEKGHWKNECPKRKTGRAVLYLGEQ